jgi:hypothetical protein
MVKWMKVLSAVLVKPGWWGAPAWLPAGQAMSPSRRGRAGEAFGPRGHGESLLVRALRSGPSSRRGFLRCPRAGSVTSQRAAEVEVHDGLRVGLVVGADAHENRVALAITGLVIFLVSPSNL